jgi:hypothetical protein
MSVKNIISGILLLFIAIASGCSVSEWSKKGFSDQEEMVWRKNGFTVWSANQWKIAGFSANKAKAWKGVDPAIAKKWMKHLTYRDDYLLLQKLKRGGVTIGEWKELQKVAKNPLDWIRSKFSYRYIMQWKKSDSTITASEAKEWINYRFRIKEIVEWRKFGFKPKEAYFKWQQKSFSALEAFQWKKYKFKSDRANTLKFYKISPKNASFLRDYKQYKRKKNTNYYKIGSAVLNAKLPLDNIEKYLDLKLPAGFTILEKRKYIEKYFIPYDRLVGFLKQCKGRLRFDFDRRSSYSKHWPQCFLVGLMPHNRVYLNKNMYQFYLDILDFHTASGILINFQSNTRSKNKTVALVKVTPNNQFDILWEKKHDFVINKNY